MSFGCRSIRHFGPGICSSSSRACRGGGHLFLHSQLGCCNGLGFVQPRLRHVVGLKGQPALASYRQRVCQRLKIFTDKTNGGGYFLGHAIGRVGVGHVPHKCRLHISDGAAHRQRQLAKFSLQRLPLALQALNHHVGGQCTTFGHLAQLARGHAQTISQGTGQARGLLHD